MLKQTLIKTLTIFAVVIVAISQTVFTQKPDASSTKTSGGSDNDWGYAVQQTNEAGRIMTGVNISSSDSDEWRTLIGKTDPLSKRRLAELKSKGLIPQPKQTTYDGNLQTGNSIQVQYVSGVSLSGLLIPRDETFSVVVFDGIGGNSEADPDDPLQRNDDDVTNAIPLQFTFDLYGTSFDSVFINNNGNLSFDTNLVEFTSTGFPIEGFPMVAAIWADVDTRNDTSGVVYVKSEENRFVVIWETVGYYDTHGDKLNEFEVIITDGTDPLVGIGNNVAFSYNDMQWTTGDASGGLDGFGGTPATVGVNKGDGVNFIQVGRFDHEGDDYDGPFDNPDGVSYLDNRLFRISVGQESDNVPPISVNFPTGNLIEVAIDDSLDGIVGFLSPESLQTTHTEVDPGDLANFDFTSTDGNVSTIEFSFFPDASQLGDHIVHFTATDNGIPAGTTNVDLTLRVIPEYGSDFGLVAYYPFDGNANDESGNSNNGVITGATLTTDRFGNSNSAYSFDGIDDFIQTTASFEFGSDSKSFSVWFNPLVLERGWIVAGGNDLNAQAFGLFIDSNINPKLMFHGNSAQYNMDFDAVLIVNQWFHVVITYDGLVIRGYLNGIVGPTKSLILSTSSENIKFGARQSLFATEFFNGSIDDIRIYNRVLTEDEIDSLYHEGGTIGISPDETLSGLPKKFALNQNYPNPFNPVTTLRFDLPEQAYVTLVVYDLLGHEVKRLVSGIVVSGYHSVVWDGTNNKGQLVGAGVYLYRISSDKFTKVNKMILLK